LIVKKEKKKESRIDNMFINEKFRSCELVKLYKPNNETAHKVGIEIKNEIFAASTLSNFKNLAAVMEIPDLLTPGIKDKIWKNPIKKTDL
tara:strand:+ start:257 stop:526 length:270 start_codon:yes stop_codon:yes gene_type:complete